MRLERLRLFNYRNYASQSWKSQGNITVLTGANGAGKTNFLEAISLLTPGRGIRSSAPASLLGAESKEWAVTGDLLFGSERIKVSTGVLPRSERRIFHINGEPAKTTQQVAELVRCTWLVPGMERLANEGASMRRKFLDRLTLGQYPEHASHLNALSKTLADRNRVLATRGTVDSSWLSALENTIAKESVIIASARADFITLMNETADLDLSFPQVKLQTVCEIQDRVLSSSALETEEYLRDTLRNSREADRERRSASVGAHKTDVLFLDRKTGRSAVNSSSGQQKLMFLALVLNYATFLKDEHGFAPLLLLDEPLVHLDRKHREMLLEYLAESNRNCFITGTDLADFETLSNDASFLEVKNGSITGI